MRGSPLLACSSAMVKSSLPSLFELSSPNGGASPAGIKELSLRMYNFAPVGLFTACFVAARECHDFARSDSIRKDGQTTMMTTLPSSFRVAWLVVLAATYSTVRQQGPSQSFCIFRQYHHGDDDGCSTTRRRRPFPKNCDDDREGVAVDAAGFVGARVPEVRGRRGSKLDRLHASGFASR